MFYDAAGAPVADLQICFGCNQWAFNGESPSNMVREVADAFGELCRDLQLRRCPQPEREEDDVNRWYTEEFRAWRRTGTPPPASEATGIAPERRLSELSSVEKRQLCAWRVLEQGTTSPRWKWDSGVEMHQMTFDECVATFPRCDVRLDEVEQAYFHGENGDREPVAPPECIERWVSPELAPCYWGVKLNVPAASAP